MSDSKPSLYYHCPEPILTASQEKAADSFCSEVLCFVNYPLRQYSRVRQAAYLVGLAACTT